MNKILLLIFLFSQTLFANTPQEDTKRLSQFVKPIPDSVWQSIASEKFSEIYEVAQGDTLYDISDRLFGDSKYWPKIWAVNNNRILNPHLIFPGRKIVFQSGTGIEPPQLGLEPEESGTSNTGGVLGQSKSQDNIQLTQSGRSNEWQQLPRQKWEQIQLKTPPEIDPNGIDRRSVVRFKSPDGFYAPIFVSSEELYSSGSLQSSTQPSDGLTKGDTVYIKSNETLTIGEQYSIVEKPKKLKSKSTSDSGLGYTHLGIVKILRQKDELYEATLLHAYFPIFRKAQIIKKLDKIKNPIPTPGPSAIPGFIMSQADLSSTELTQHTYAIVDRGSRDEIQPGMIFRAYQYKDPKTKKEITENDIIFLADFIVVQVSDSFSTVIGIKSVSTVPSGSKVVLLTDVSEYLKKRNLRVDIVEPDSVFFDSLERMDLGDEINEKEKDEVSDLESLEDTELFDDNLDNESVDDLNDLDDLDSFDETEEQEFLDNSTEENALDDLGESSDEDVSWDEFDDTESLPEEDFATESIDDGFGAQEEIPATQQPATQTTPSTPETPQAESPEDIPLEDAPVEGDELDDFDLLE